MLWLVFYCELKGQIFPLMKLSLLMKIYHWFSLIHLWHQSTNSFSWKWTCTYYFYRRWRYLLISYRKNVWFCTSLVCRSIITFSNRGFFLLQMSHPVFLYTNCYKSVDLTSGVLFWTYGTLNFSGQKTNSLIGWLNWQTGSSILTCCN
jgi:hypothetical protein